MDPKQQLGSNDSGPKTDIAQHLSQVQLQAFAAQAELPLGQDCTQCSCFIIGKGAGLHQNREKIEKSVVENCHEKRLVETD